MTQFGRHYAASLRLRHSPLPIINTLSPGTCQNSVAPKGFFTPTSSRHPLHSHIFMPHVYTITSSDIGRNQLAAFNIDAWCTDHPVGV